MSVERLRARRRRLPARRHAPDARPSVPRLRLRADDRAARATSRRTASRTTSPRAAIATSCGRSPRTIYSIPSERVIGSSNALRYLEDEHGGTITLRRRAGRLRRRPGQADPDLEPDRPPARSSPAGTRTATSRCCSYAGGRDRPALRLLVLHDDADREFDYTAGAEESLEAAADQGWTVVSIKHDWKTVFADTGA